MPIADLRGWRISVAIDVNGVHELTFDTNLLVLNSVSRGAARRVELSTWRVGRRATKGTSTAGFECGCRRWRYPNTANGSNRPCNRPSVSFTPNQPSATVA